LFGFFSSLTLFYPLIVSDLVDPSLISFMS
jgi:hypothetical protein